MFLFSNPCPVGQVPREETLPPSPASLVGIPDPAPPRKPLRLFLCQALSPETTGPEALTAGTAASEAGGGGGGFLRGGWGGGGGGLRSQACPFSGEMWDPVSPMLLWMAWLGHLVTRVGGQEGVKGTQSVRGVGRILGSSSRSLEAAPWECRGGGHFPQTLQSSSWPRAGDRSLWVRGRSVPPRPPACLPACLRLRARALRSAGAEEVTVVQNGWGERWREPSAGKAGKAVEGQEGGEV